MFLDGASRFISVRRAAKLFEFAEDCLFALSGCSLDLSNKSCDGFHVDLPSCLRITSGFPMRFGLWLNRGMRLFDHLPVNLRERLIHMATELHVPAGQPVSLRMEAKDVIHAFWVPEFRLKQDVIPGQPTVLNFTPTRPGTYPIVCAELCGPYHGGMRSSVVVEEPETYQAWFNANNKLNVADA